MALSRSHLESSRGRHVGIISVRTVKYWVFKKSLYSRYLYNGGVVSSGMMFLPNLMKIRQIQNL
jgi:hypothetical protein